MSSRVGRKPINVPQGVEINIKERDITVKGKKGSLATKLHRLVTVKNDNNVITIVPKADTKIANMQAGTARALLSNMVVGVSEGFERKLTLVGVGYRAQVQGKSLNLSLGFSHPVNFIIPEGITIETPSQTEIFVRGADKGLVGQVAANIRRIRPPEPYKGKGVRYADELVILKETKKK